jgi:excisionase family DNA binding protein
MPPDPLSLSSPAIPHLLEVDFVAHRLSVSPEFVRRLLRKEELAGIRLGGRWRVDAADLQRWIDVHRRGQDASSRSATTAFRSPRSLSS